MPSYSKLYRMIFGLAAVLPTASLAAQPDAGRLLNEQQQLMQPRLDSLPQEERQPSARPVPREAAGVTVLLKAVRFSGDVEVVGEERLQALVGDALGKELDFNGLQALADRVTDTLKGEGYFLAHAYLPKQYLTGGVVEIALLAGRLQTMNDAVVIQGRLRISPQRLKRIAQGAVSPGQALRQSDLERAVLLINDLPGISALSNIERGSEAGSVHLVVGANEGPLLSGEVGLDNFGNRYTGAWRGSARLNLNDPLRIGDQLSLSVVGATDFQIGQLSYGWPVNFSGLRGMLSYSTMKYTIGKDLADLDASGSSNIIGAGISYPFIRTRFLNLWGGVNYASKVLVDDAFGEHLRDKHIDVWNTRVSGDSYDRLGGGGLNNFSATLTTGDLDLSKVAADLALDQTSGAGTNGSYTKLGYSLARLQKLTGRLSLFGALNGQFADKNLDSSEKFILGGPLGVRAYPIGEGAGDEGWLGNIEVRYELPLVSALGNLQWIGFVDAGQIKLHDSPWHGSIITSSGDNSYTLSGIGMGLNVTKGTAYAVHFAWATTLGSNPGRSLTGMNSDGRSDDSRMWLYGVVRL